jgi:hypothetical protein
MHCHILFFDQHNGKSTKNLQKYPLPVPTYGGSGTDLLLGGRVFVNLDIQ